MFIKIIKKVALLTVAISLFASTASAEFYSVPEEIQSHGRQVYTSARSFFNGRSFRGYCGTYVKCQLRAMGIFDGGFDFNGNGNQWYRNFENVSTTSGGYYVYRESGRDCITKLTEKYGNNLKNIVLSFPIQSGYSARYPGAGHAFILYEIRDGIAYYSESFGFSGYKEGEVIAEDIDSLMERYTRRHGEITGCVLLSEMPLYEGLNQEMLLQVKAHLESMSDIGFVAQQFDEMSKSRTVA